MPEATVDAPIRERLTRAAPPGVLTRFDCCAWRAAYARDVAALLRLIDSLADRVHAAHEVLARNAERKERKGG